MPVHRSTALPCQTPLQVTRRHSFQASFVSPTLFEPGLDHMKLTDFSRARLVVLIDPPVTHWRTFALPSAARRCHRSTRPPPRSFLVLSAEHVLETVGGPG